MEMPNDFCKIGDILEFEVSELHHEAIARSWSVDGLPSTDHHGTMEIDGNTVSFLIVDVLQCPKLSIEIKSIQRCQ